MDNNKKKFPWFPFYPQDWLSETKILRMSDMASYYYFLILLHMWNGSDNQCSIENNDKIIAKILRISEKKWIKIRSEIQWENDPVLIEEDGRLISNRLRNIKQEQDIKSKKASLSAYARWGKTHSEGNANVMRTHSEGNATRGCVKSQSQKKETEPKKEKEKEKKEISSFMTGEEPIIIQGMIQTDPIYQELIKVQCRVTTYLNEVTRNNIPVELNRYAFNKNIIELLALGYTEQSLTDVIDKKNKDPNFKQHMSPKTLFKLEYFQDYLTQNPGDYPEEKKPERDYEKEHSDKFPGDGAKAFEPGGRLNP